MRVTGVSYTPKSSNRVETCILLLNTVLVAIGRQNGFGIDLETLPRRLSIVQEDIFALVNDQTGSFRLSQGGERDAISPLDISFAIMSRACQLV
jgi:hypothetical protein